MANLLIFVLDSPAQCLDVLDVWTAAGVSGATILESTGLARVRSATRDDVPLFPSLRDFMARREYHHRTLFAVIESDETLERVIAATENLIGDLSQANTGLLFVVPVTRVVGLRKEGGPT